MKKILVILLIATVLITCAACKASPSTKKVSDVLSADNGRSIQNNKNTADSSKESTNPFLAVNIETTPDDIVAIYGTPTKIEYRDDGTTREYRYDNFRLFGFSGELYFNFFDDQLRVGFSYRYPGDSSWSPQYDGDVYPATVAEKVDAQNLFDQAKGCFTEKYGEPHSQGSGGCGWDLSTEFFEHYLSISVDKSFPVRIYLEISC